MNHEPQASDNNTDKNGEQEDDQRMNDDEMTTIAGQENDIILSGDAKEISPR